MIRTAMKRSTLDWNSSSKLRDPRLLDEARQQILDHLGMGKQQLVAVVVVACHAGSTSLAICRSIPQPRWLPCSPAPLARPPPLTQRIGTKGTPPPRVIPAAARQSR